MEYIRDYLSCLNEQQILLDIDSIKEIGEYLIKLFDCSIEGIEFVENDIYPMCYDFKSKKIFIDYNFLIRFYSKKANKSDLDKTSLINYYILFALVHEVTHQLQQDYELNEDAKKIYDLCFKYVTDNNGSKLATLVRNMIYNNLHDYFAIEINANVVATEFVVGIVDREYRNYFMRELYLILKKCYLDYDLESMYSEDLMFDVDGLDFGVSMYQKMRLGLYLDTLELESLKKIRLEKIINCKSFNN